MHPNALVPPVRSSPVTRSAETRTSDPVSRPEAPDRDRVDAAGPAVAVERIVYVEDSDDEVFLTRIVFERERIAPTLVHHARFDDLERALADGTSGDLAVALVVIDLNLKLTKGTDAVRRLRELPAARDAVIGVCTGSEDPADRRDVEAAGGDFFVAKPLDTACLEQICAVVPRLELVRPEGGGCALVLNGPRA